MTFPTGEELHEVSSEVVADDDEIRQAKAKHAAVQANADRLAQEADALEKAHAAAIARKARLAVVLESVVSEEKRVLDLQVKLARLQDVGVACTGSADTGSAGQVGASN